MGVVYFNQILSRVAPESRLKSPISMFFARFPKILMQNLMKNDSKKNINLGCPYEAPKIAKSA